MTPIEVHHDCPGPSCPTCRMAALGYVRSAVTNYWRQPNNPRAPVLSDAQVEAMTGPQMMLFEFEEVASRG